MRLSDFVGWTEHDTWNREDWTDRAAVALAVRLRQGSNDPAVALECYERLRLARVTCLYQMVPANKLRFHMRDGPERGARDAGWARAGDRSPEALRCPYNHEHTENA